MCVRVPFLFCFPFVDGEKMGEEESQQTSLTRRSQLRRASRVETSRVQHVRTTTQSKALHARMDGSFQMTMRASWPAPVKASSRLQLSSCRTVSAEHAIPTCSAALRGDGAAGGDGGDGGDGAPKGMFIAGQRLVSVSFLLVLPCGGRGCWVGEEEEGRGKKNGKSTTRTKKKCRRCGNGLRPVETRIKTEGDDTISEMEAMERLSAFRRGRISFSFFYLLCAFFFSFFLFFLVCMHMVYNKHSAFLNEDI